jgi:hypothetical protein
MDLLRDLSESELSDKIIKFKTDLKNVSVSEISKISSVKEITKWIPKGKRVPFGELEQIKNVNKKKLGTPAHVKGAIYYNDFLIYFNLTDKYENIRDGEKAKFIYLKTNPYNLDGLSFKGYDDPSEIIEFIEKYADKYRLFKSELQNKLENFYSALKWRFPSENEMVFRKLFQKNN